MLAREIALLLPDVYRRAIVPGSVLAALLELMEALHAPAEEALRSFPEYLDPLVCPERFVPMLAAWVDLARLDDTSAGRLEPDRLRLLVHLAAELGRRRGTEEALLEVVAVATGVRDCRIVRVGSFRVRFVVASATPAQLELVRAVVEQEKPAHLVVEVAAEDGSDVGGAGGGS